MNVFAVSLHKDTRLVEWRNRNRLHFSPLEEPLHPALSILRLEADFRFTRSVVHLVAVVRRVEGELEMRTDTSGNAWTSLQWHQNYHYILIVTEFIDEKLLACVELICDKNMII